MGNTAKILGVVILVGIVGAAFVVPFVAGLFDLSYEALRVWAVLMTFTLPVVFVGGYFVGRSEGVNRWTGLEVGVNTVVSAANQVADIRDRSAQRVRQHSPVSMNMLPIAPVVSHQRQLESGEIEL